LGFFWVRFKVWRITIAPFYFWSNNVDKACNSKPGFPIFGENYSKPVNTTMAGVQMVIWPIILCFSVFMAGVAMIVYLLAILFNLVGQLLRFFGAIAILSE